MKMKKWFMVLLLGVALLMSGCSKTAVGDADSGQYPDKPITLIVSYAAGGGTDTGARILQQYLEKELGVAIKIENKPGGAGWIGWSELAKAKPDGYTIGYINSPNIITGYLDPKNKRSENLESFQFLANHVLDPGVVAIKTGETRFTNFEEMIEYAKENELTATTSGFGSNDHMAILKMNEYYGTKITPVHTKGAAEGSTQVLGGHVDLFVAKTGEAVNLHNNGQLEAIAVFSEERSPFLEDVPTTVELGYEDLIFRSARGLAAPAGLPDDKLKVLSEALQKAIENEEHVKEMGEQGLQVHYLDSEGYKEMMVEDEEDVKSLSDLLGY
ncbi:MAG TPA: tripartite tricarboxylate transporter substrate binding protein [Bacillus sp. (in: firmicutes)]|nr:tripartite tricarboxylate transporter substrate binding protein [Bacillus sp. (in: firmicutes)]